LDLQQQDLSSAAGAIILLSWKVGYVKKYVILTVVPLIIAGLVVFSAPCFPPK
jgi:hypothetical protein